MAYVDVPIEKLSQDKKGCEFKMQQGFWSSFADTHSGSGVSAQEKQLKLSFGIKLPLWDDNPDES